MQNHFWIYARKWIYRINIKLEPENLIKHEAIVRFCWSQRLRRARHVERIPDDRTLKIITKWMSQWKPSRGRPRKRCQSTLKKIEAGQEGWKTGGKLIKTGNSGEYSWRRPNISLGCIVIMISTKKSIRQSWLF